MTYDSALFLIFHNANVTMFTRWFSHSVRAEPLFDRLRQHDSASNAEFESTWLGVFGRNRKLRKRMDAFDDAAEKYDFTQCGNVDLYDDFRLPLVYDEPLEGHVGNTPNAWLCGEWKHDEFAWLQGSHLIDPIFRGKDQGFISFVTTVMFGRKGHKENRVKNMHFETIVFSEELPLPDVILGHSWIGVTPYLKRELKKISQKLQDVPKSHLLVWGATSDPRGTVGLYRQLADLFNSRTCLIQVIGGRVVVFLNYTGSEVSGLVKSVRDVENELNFAREIFQRLRVVAEAQTPVTESTISYEEAADEMKVAAFQRRAERNQRPAGRRIGWGKLVAGVMMMGFCGLMLTGSLIVNKENQTVKKKQDQRYVLKTSACIGGLGLILAAWGIGAFASRKRDSDAPVTIAEAQSTGLSSAKYFQSPAQ